ncbi:MAG: tRNA (adenosine(37)-N6)-threonylcarbamoyltransferase complex ATPase subunit type 1 TsaE [Saprospiraceae bacterium]|nr:tRNA (adenosine(37)-N6)-threonylcarbamoyltransferase complex ATPase subunit type 1 TsaE [Saprospiraceae bacterium]
MHKQYSCSSLVDLDKTVVNILTDCIESKIFCFIGNLGAGKTTLIKSICKCLGYQHEVTSPTYSLINHYSVLNANIFHMDLYRLTDVEEALEIGIEEYLHSGHYCLIEWPQLIIPLIEDLFYIVNISVDENQDRKIEVIGMINPT